jgi:hypothetical protein
MPGFDGTGPLGHGPMTGGGFGYCGTSRRAGYAFGGRGSFGRFGAGRGAGFARRGWIGRGGGQGYGYLGPWSLYGSSRRVDSETELAQLHQEATDLKAYLKDVEARIGELEKTSG